MVFAKKHLAIISIAVVSVCASVVMINRFSKNNGGIHSVKSDNVYTMTLNASNRPAGLTSSFQNSFTGDVKTQIGNDVQFTFVNAKSTEGDFATLAPRGMIHNFGASDEKLTAVNGVSFTGSGTLLFKPAIGSSAQGAILAEVDPVAIEANAATVTVPTCDYFQLVAADGGAQITSLQFSYSCDPLAYNNSFLNGTYTGVANDGFTYKLAIDEGSATVDSLDKQSNDHYTGTAALSSKTAVSLSLAGGMITYSFSFTGYSLEYVSSSAGAPQVTFNRVFNVEDFESYSATGQGYTNSTTKYQTSGLRANYYADYYTGSGSSEIGGSGWQIMTSTDNSTYNSAKGHAGTKTGIFKFSKGSKMRYISMNELYGVKTIYKGTTLSFWARSAYTNTSFNTNHANNIPLRFYAFYSSPLTSSTQGNRDYADVTVLAGSAWQRFEVTLNPSKLYYGFGFYSEQNTDGGNAYIPIDDIQIYTASPYAEYVAPVAATGVTVSPDNLELTTGGHSQLSATVAPNDATNKNVSWSSNNTSVATVDNNGYVTAVAPGNATITATTEDGGYTDTCAVTVSVPALVYPEGTFKGIANVLGDNYDIVLAIGNQSNGLVAVRLSNQDAQATGITFNEGTKAVTITTTGSYSDYTFGTITGTYDPNTDSIVNISCGGTISAGVSNNGSITALKATTSSTSVFADCDGDTAQLQSQFKRRYGDPWTVDTTNADKITSNTTQYVAGTNSLKLRGWDGGRIALNFLSDFGSAVAVKNVQFWVYNPSGSDVTIRMWYYQATNLGSNGETGSVTAKAGQWTYVAMGFGTEQGANRNIYNFQIADFTKSGAYLSFDNIYLFS